jgi:hypothetical protein
MNSIAAINPAQSIQHLYHAINSMMSAKPKDKVDMILEPLQSMIQLSLLSTCPVGTKLHIQENILYLQTPNLIQPVARWYHSDKKDDLYFLYSVIKRFIKWYHPVNNKKSPLSLELYQLISTMSMDGLTILFKTYSSCNSTSVIQVIQMYKNLLEFNNDKILMDEYLANENHKINIDEVFEHIIVIYDKTILQIVYNTLLLIRQEESPDNQYTMISGLNIILNKYNKMITEWIKVNLVI